MAIQEEEEKKYNHRHQRATEYWISFLHSISLAPSRGWQESLFCNLKLYSHSQKAAIKGENRIQLVRFAISFSEYRWIQVKQSVCIRSIKWELKQDRIEWNVKLHRDILLNRLQARQVNVFHPLNLSPIPACLSAHSTSVCRHVKSDWARARESINRTFDVCLVLTLHTQISLVDVAPFFPCRLINHSSVIIDW